MCSSRKILWSLLLLSVLEVGLGVASIVLGAVGLSWVREEHKPQQGDASPIWSGLCFLICGMCGVLCARKRTGLISSVRVEDRKLLVPWTGSLTTNKANSLPLSSGACNIITLRPLRAKRAPQNSQDKAMLQPPLAGCNPPCILVFIFMVP
ncbi:hypothetical protein J4Q44_G00033770 [Coregonus suidteri]|uniref:Transmembrane protein 196 n=1 Tax=Coregonus suidteri TaxID=861788 RepID=A0AAN8MIK9_9TELE